VSLAASGPISRFPINFCFARDPGGIDYFLKADLSVPIFHASHKPVSGKAHCVSGQLGWPNECDGNLSAVISIQVPTAADTPLEADLFGLCQCGSFLQRILRLQLALDWPVTSSL
jgi:hypothetical protein